MKATRLLDLTTRRALLAIAGLLSIVVVCTAQQPTPPRAASPSPAGPAAKAPAAFRVMTYNIHHGEGTELEWTR